jgi:hypothetical protein
MKILDAPDFLDLPDEAGGLFAVGAQTSFFSLPEWYDLLARHGLEPEWRPRLYYSGGAALIGCVPASGRPREIRGCCNSYTTEHSILARQNAESEVRQLVAALAREKPSTDALLLPGLDPAAGDFAGALLGLKDAGFVAKPFFCWGTWYDPTTGRDFDSYFAARPSVLKNTWRRKLAALNKSARVKFRDSGDVERFIAVYDDVYRRSWKVPEPFPQFISALVRMAARKGALRFGVLEADGTAIAAQFWTVWRGRAIIHKLANDERSIEFSPGTLLTMHMIRHVLERDRPDEINFGRGDDDYKQLWTSARRERWGIEAANPRTASGVIRAARLIAAKARDYIRGRKRA